MEALSAWRTQRGDAAEYREGRVGDATGESGVLRGGARMVEGEGDGTRYKTKQEVLESMLPCKRQVNWPSGTPQSRRIEVPAAEERQASPVLIWAKLGQIYQFRAVSPLDWLILLCIGPSG